MFLPWAIRPGFFPALANSPITSRANQTYSAITVFFFVPFNMAITGVTEVTALNDRPDLFA